MRRVDVVGMPHTSTFEALELQLVPGGDDGATELDIRTARRNDIDFGIAQANHVLEVRPRFHVRHEPLHDFRARFGAESLRLTDTVFGNGNGNDLVQVLFGQCGCGDVAAAQFYRSGSFLFGAIEFRFE